MIGVLRVWSGIRHTHGRKWSIALRNRFAVWASGLSRSACRQARLRMTVARLIEKLRSRSGTVVSITDIEWAFPERGNRLDTLVALSFQRETLASLPVRQIWWIPSTLTEQFILVVPDLDSWFRLRLHLPQ